MSDWFIIFKVSRNEFMNTFKMKDHFQNLNGKKH